MSCTCEREVGLIVQADSECPVHGDNPMVETSEGSLPRAVQEALAEASQSLLEAIGETAEAQYKLLRVREIPEASPEVIQKAAQRYRSTEAECQQALSRLLSVHTNILEWKEGKTRHPASHTVAEAWVRPS